MGTRASKQTGSINMTEDLLAAAPARMVGCAWLHSPQHRCV